MNVRKAVGSMLAPFGVTLLYLFLYVPIIILIVFSFNDAQFPYTWKGFTLHWYKDLWHSVEIWDALKNSLIVASSSVCLSLTMGILLVFYSSRSHLARLVVLFYGGLAVPEIVLAVGLLSFFSIFSIPLGLTSLIAGHTLIGLGYVIPMIYARFSELDYSLTEASLDLGATRNQTLLKVILPLLSPGLLAAGLLMFVISLDDFVISFFCSGASAQTLPMYIFVMIRSGATPVVNALSTVLLIVTSLVVMVFSSLKIKKTDMF